MDTVAVIWLLFGSCSWLDSYVLQLFGCFLAGAADWMSLQLSGCYFAGAIGWMSLQLSVSYLVGALD